MTVLRFEKFSRHSGAGLSYFMDFVFRLVFELIVLLNGQTILAGDDSEVLQPPRVDVETSRTDSHASGKYLLAVSSQQPVHKDFGRIRMRLILYDGQVTIASGGVKTFLGNGQRGHGKIGLDERKELRIAYP